MAIYDLEPLLAPISDDAPSGENLEYDADFLALERAAATKAERVVGDSVKQAEEPDWVRVAERSQALLARSKDLRLATHLTAAWTRTAGIPGWTAGLALIRGLLEQHWSTVHPQLDAEDNDDPTYRVNSVAPISDPVGLLGHVRTTPFVQSPRLGRFSLRDLRIANGSLKTADAQSVDGGELPTQTEIEACCMDCPYEQLAETTAAAAEALEHAKAIDAIFMDRVGTAGPELKPLLSDAHELKSFLESQRSLRAPQASTDDMAANEAAAQDAGTVSAGAVQAQGIQGPQDVLRCLDDLCDYYARKEPSSPVPLLLRRAQRLVGKNFLDLLKDLAPGGLGELQVVSGQGDDE
ncbi:type VI secretion system protein TssA [Dyella japonica]|uniref:Type VI secretion protein n=1 Tax=Dyella japonica A8 TaxID=1217721 RepID=A0A075K2P4_9GAMM|nr:type VI secretion system protein TssA [Dyella japonica]AIF48215.1 type VI secretion protein [Dyella japonica A8]